LRQDFFWPAARTCELNIHRAAVFRESRRTTMSDDKTKTGGEDRKRINLAED
jgi:hypothetical protein